MDSALLIPLADTIPVAWGWFQVLLVATFMLHLLAMNILLGSSVIALVDQIRGRARTTGPVLSPKLPIVMAFTVNFGVAPLLFLQVLFGNLVYTSSILMAVYWLSVVFIIIAAYYSLYVFQYKYEAWPRARTVFLAVAVACILAVAFFFSNNMILMISPERWPAYFANRSGTILSLTDPTLIPRYLHFVLASLAAGGLFLAVTSRWKKSEAKAEEQLLLGMKWFSFATVAQLAVGIWFLLALPQDVMLMFMGGNGTATALFMAGLILAALLLLFGFQNKVWPSLYTFLGTVVVMVLMRDLVRTAYLKGYFNPAELMVKPEYGPMVLFVVILLVGLAAVVYMLKLGFETGKEVTR
ncbi:MAG: hypothetical protein EOM25_10695 [Deltaproteobacteria bacterium]|nr:hypothetical protein [Deltaproteobacteria bacterium]